jgi:molybdate transport system ATP-binding protein
VTDPSDSTHDVALVTRAVLQRGDFRLDAEFTVGPGEVLAVLGPNGAGKTTLLRLLAGLLPLSDGFIRVGGQTWDDAASGKFVPAMDRAVGLVFQDYRLFPHLSVLDNVAFAERAKGGGRHRSREVAAGVLERLGLSQLSGRRPAQLSGGQAQRVALARALAASPTMLLLDEPLAALDARTRLEIRTELRRHLSGFDGPSIVVTHDPLEALVLADRILVLEGGRIVQEGTPAEVSRRPSTEYVARLMGLNLYFGVRTDSGTGEIRLDGAGSDAGVRDTGVGDTGVGAGGVLFATAGSSDAGPANPADAVDSAGAAGAAGARVLVVVSPSAISLHAREPVAGSPRNVWNGVVSGVELLTDRVRVAVSGRPDALVDVTAAAVAELGLSAGQEVWLSAKATEVLAYPDPGLGTSRG